MRTTAAGAYTRIVARSSLRAISAAVVLVLGGSPAVALACEALCIEAPAIVRDMSGHDHLRDGHARTGVHEAHAADPHGAHALDGAAQHDDHAAPHSIDGGEGTATDAREPRVSRAVPAHCCQQAPGYSRDAAARLRQSDGSLTKAPLLTPVVAAAPVRALTAWNPPRSRHRSVAPDAARTPLVLRI